MVLAVFSLEIKENIPLNGDEWPQLNVSGQNTVLEELTQVHPCDSCA